MKIFCLILLLDPVISQLKTDWMAMIHFISKIEKKKEKRKKGSSSNHRSERQDNWMCPFLFCILVRDVK